MKKLLSFTLSLIIMSSFLCQGAFAIKDTGELVSVGCDICDSAYPIIRNPNASTAKTYEAYYGVETINGLTSNTSIVYHDHVSGWYIYQALYNGKTICLPCLEKKVNEYKAANGIPTVGGTTAVDTTTGAADVPITVTRDAPTFSVTVPTSMPISVGADGKVTTAGNVAIENNSSRSVCVKSVTINAASGWTLAKFDKDAMRNEAIDSKKLGFSMTMGPKTAATTKDGQTEAIGSYTASDVTIDADSQLAITYDGVIPTQVNGVAADTQAASVVFTVDWAA